MLTFHTAHSKFKTFEKQFDEKISYLRKDHPDLKYGTVSKATRDEMIKKLNEEKSKQFEDRQVGEKISPFVNEYFPDKQSKQSKKDSQTTGSLDYHPRSRTTRRSKFDHDFTQIASNDDDGAGLYSQVVQTLNPGDYYIAVHGYNYSSMSSCLRINY